MMSNSGNMLSANLSISERLQHGLNQCSLVLRCQEISNLLQEVSSKDGVYIIRCVIENIFGICEEGISPSTQQQQQQLGGGWGLRIITLSEHQEEFQTLRRFLSPTGPLLTLIYRLSHDPFQLLPFPIAWLPSKVRNEIQEGNAGPFYTSKIQNLGPGKIATNLLFNAFEYYMFHFGYLLVGNGTQRWNIYWTSIKDSLYPTLLEDYLSIYLPCHATLPPGPSSTPTTPRGILSPVLQRSPNVNPLSNTQCFGLFASPIASAFRPADYNPLNDYTMTGNFAGAAGTYQTSSPLHPVPYSEVSIWTSQTLVQILMEIWINICIYHTTTSTTQLTPVQVSIISSHLSLNNIFVPDGDHVRAVRMVIKHFHYFSNSPKPHQPSPLDPMRRNIWPLCRKSIYYFIKHLFVHWPLDSSFRLVLETWLSHIQPWRYGTYTPMERFSLPGGKEGEFHRSVDLKWKPFIAENLLFYTNLFGLLLKRILKLDLASPKNAQILFRVAKVFSQENLVTMIQDIENCLEVNQLQKSSLGFIGGQTQNYSISSLRDSLDSTLSPQAITQLVRSHILEVERSNYHYTFMFGDSVLKDVVRLINLTRKTCDNLKMELASNTGNAHAIAAESSNWLKAFFKSLMDVPKSTENENSMEEVQKCISHLEMSVNQFAVLFDINIPESVSEISSSQQRSQLTFNESLLGSPEKLRSPDQEWTNSGLCLTDRGRWQLLNGLKRLDIIYEGDPDLKPICTFEIAFLVRFLHFICNLINTKYETKLTEYYYRRDVLGRLLRVFLFSPQTIYENVKDLDADISCTKIKRSLPPRLSLRVMAQKRVIITFMLFYFVIWASGLSFIGVTAQLILPLFVTYVLYKAYCSQEASPTLRISSIRR